MFIQGLGDVEPGYVRPQAVTVPKRQGTQPYHNHPNLHYNIRFTYTSFLSLILEEGFIAGTGVNTNNQWWFFGFSRKGKS